MSDLDDALKIAAAHTPERSDIPTEIQHPTDLIVCDPYFRLVTFLVQLDVLPGDVFFMGSRYWDDFI